MTRFTRFTLALAVMAIALVALVGSASAQKKPGQQCGGFFGLPCAMNEYCNFKPGTCGFADMLGQCTATPKRCPRIRLPVCGCDGKTYANDCLRQQARTSLRSKGACKSTM
jgi:hypothetical protein